jgi:uncharacterized membrane protein
MTLTPLLEAPTIIVVHAVSAVMALLLGAVQLFRKKGDPVHRFIGASWVALMLMVSLSSFLIWTIRVWWLFSPIHLISIFTLVMLWRGIGFARRGNIKAHSRTMEYLYFLALVVTGLLTFIPGRIMYRVAFGQDGPTLQKLLVFAGVIAAAAVLSGLAAMWRKTSAGIEFVEAH